MNKVLILILFIISFTVSCVDTTVRQCMVITDLSSVPDSLFVVDTSKEHLALMNSKIWYKDTILVGFINGDEDIHNKIITTAKTWEKYCRLVIKKVPLDEADIRITVAPGGSWSYLGTDCKLIKYPNPTMQLGWVVQHRHNQTELNRVIIHEFGHALGATHEHQSPNANIPWDSAKVYAFYARSGWNKVTVNTNLFNRLSESEVTASPYDPYSIMHYPIAGSLLKDPSKAIPWNNTYPSDQDQITINLVYPKPIIRDTVTVDSCIVMFKKVLKDSAYCKDTSFIRIK